MILSKRELLTRTFVFIGVLCLCMTCIGNKNLGFDEFCSMEIARSLHSMTNILHNYESNMWLYYALLHFWMKLGENALLLRSLSALFAAGAVLVLYIIAAEFINKKTGLIAAGLMALNVFFISHAQEARGYSLLLLLGISATLFFCRMLRHGGIGSAVIYALLSVATLYTHYFAALLILVQFMFMFFTPFYSQRKRVLVLAFGIIAAATISILVLQPLQVSQIGWIAKPGIEQVYEVLYQISGSSRIILGCLCIAGAWALLKTILENKQNKTNVWFHSYLASSIALPILLAFAASRLITPVFLSKYLILSLPGLIMLAASGISSIKRKMLLYPVLALMGLSLASGLFDHYKPEINGWQNAARLVASQGKPSDGILYYTYFSQYPFEYYMSRAIASTEQPTAIPITHGVKGYYSFIPALVPIPDTVVIAGLAQFHNRIWLVLSHDRINTPVRKLGRELVINNLSKNFTAVKEWKFTNAEVVLWEHRPPLPVPAP